MTMCGCVCICKYRHIYQEGTLGAGPSSSEAEGRKACEAQASEGGGIERALWGPGFL